MIVGTELRWYFRKLTATGRVFLGIDSLAGIDSSLEAISPERKFLVICTFGKREKTHILDEKSISSSKTEVSWTMHGDFIPYSFPTWFLLFGNCSGQLPRLH
jgi:hypothetical protein